MSPIPLAGAKHPIPLYDAPDPAGSYEENEIPMLPERGAKGRRGLSLVGFARADGRADRQGSSRVAGKK